MRAVPPMGGASQRRGVWWMALGLGAALAVGSILFFLNPAENSFYPRCFFHLMTGWDCPGCGGLRATHQLLHGHWREAWTLNPLLVSVLPIIAYFAVRPFVLRYTNWKWPSPSRTVFWIWVAAITVIVFGVVRNFPWSAWLAQ